MTLGKNKCRILKEIRRKIADENDIPYVTRECSYQGECSGTCPRCESELRYLERQLALRESLGKRVAVAALCAGMALSAAGCGAGRTAGEPETELGGAVAWVDTEPTPEPTKGPAPTPELVGALPTPEPTEEPEVFVTTGEVAWPEDETGEAVEPLPEPEPVEWELSGMVAWEPEAHE